MRYTKRLKNLRIDNDLAQKDVANILNISQSTYSQYERGKYMLPLETLKNLCIFYNVSADYILGFTDKPKALPKK